MKSGNAADIYGGDGMGSLPELPQMGSGSQPKEDVFEKSNSLISGNRRFLTSDDLFKSYSDPSAKSTFAQSEPGQWEKTKRPLTTCHDDSSYNYSSIQSQYGGDNMSQAELTYLATNPPGATGNNPEDVGFSRNTTTSEKKRIRFQDGTRQYDGGRQSRCIDGSASLLISDMVRLKPTMSSETIDDDLLPPSDEDGCQCKPAARRCSSSSSSSSDCCCCDDNCGQVESRRSSAGAPYAPNTTFNPSIACNPTNSYNPVNIVNIASDEILKSFEKWQSVIVSRQQPNTLQQQSLEMPQQNMSTATVDSYAPDDKTAVSYGVVRDLTVGSGMTSPVAPLNNSPPDVSAVKAPAGNSAISPETAAEAKLESRPGNRPSSSSDKSKNKGKHHKKSTSRRQKSYERNSDQNKSTNNLVDSNASANAIKTEDDVNSKRKARDKLKLSNTNYKNNRFEVENTEFLPQQQQTSSRSMQNVHHAKKKSSGITKEHEDVSVVNDKQEGYNEKAAESNHSIKSGGRKGKHRSSKYPAAVNNRNLNFENRSYENVHSTRAAECYTDLTIVDERQIVSKSNLPVMSVEQRKSTSKSKITDDKDRYCESLLSERSRVNVTDSFRERKSIDRSTRRSARSSHHIPTTAGLRQFYKDDLRNTSSCTTLPHKLTHPTSCQATSSVPATAGSTNIAAADAAAVKDGELKIEQVSSSREDIVRTSTTNQCESTSHRVKPSTSYLQAASGMSREAVARLSLQQVSEVARANLLSAAQSQGQGHTAPTTATEPGLQLPNNANALKPCHSSFHSFVEHEREVSLTLPSAESFVFRPPDTDSVVLAHGAQCVDAMLANAVLVNRRQLIDMIADVTAYILFCSSSSNNSWEESQIDVGYKSAAYKARVIIRQVIESIVVEIRDILSSAVEGQRDVREDRARVPLGDIGSIVEKVLQSSSTSHVVLHALRTADHLLDSVAQSFDVSRIIRQCHADSVLTLVKNVRNSLPSGKVAMQDDITSTTRQLTVAEATRTVALQVIDLAFMHRTVDTFAFDFETMHALQEFGYLVC